jgi:hypothetical protein
MQPYPRYYKEGGELYTAAALSKDPFDKELGLTLQLVLMWCGIERILTLLETDARSSSICETHAS